MQTKNFVTVQFQKKRKFSGKFNGTYNCIDIGYVSGLNAFKCTERLYPGETETLQELKERAKNYIMTLNNIPVDILENQ